MPAEFAQNCPSLTVDPFADTFLSDPFGHHALIRDPGAVVWLERYGVYASARFAEVGAVLGDHETFCSGRGVSIQDYAIDPPKVPPSMLLETDPPQHERNRRIMTKVVSPGAIKHERVRWVEKAHALVDGLLARGDIDIATDIGGAFPMAVFPDTIGIQRDGRENLLIYAETITNSFGRGPPDPATMPPAVRDAFAWVADSCRRETLLPGGWGRAVHEAGERGDCTEREAELLVRSFLTAGLDSTITGIGNLFRAFAVHPDQWQLLRTQPALRRRVFDEAVRFDSPFTAFFRTTTRDTMLGEVDIPEGSKILLFLAAANRDPRRWPDADRFDITRVTSGHVGFGFGIHQCLGQMVARMEADVLLEVMIDRVARIEATGPGHWRLNNILHALASQPARILAA